MSGCGMDYQWRAVLFTSHATPDIYVCLYGISDNFKITRFDLKRLVSWKIIFSSNQFSAWSSEIDLPAWIPLNMFEILWGDVVMPSVLILRIFPRLSQLWSFKINFDCPHRQYNGQQHTSLFLLHCCSGWSHSTLNILFLYQTNISNSSISYMC